MGSRFSTPAGTKQKINSNKPKQKNDKHYNSEKQFVVSPHVVGVSVKAVFYSN